MHPESISLRTRRRIASAVLAGLLAGVPMAVAEPDDVPLPRSGRHVVDLAQILSPQARRQLDAAAWQIGVGGPEIVLVTIPARTTYQVRSVTELARELVFDWRVGLDHPRGGVVIVVAADEWRASVACTDAVDDALVAALPSILYRRLAPHIAHGRLENGLWNLLIGIAEATGRRSDAMPPRLTRPLPPRVRRGRWVPWVIAIAGIAGLAIFVARAWRRRIPARCARCAAPVQRLPDDVGEHLDHGQRTELQIGAARFDGWRCSTGHVHLRRWARREVPRCPRCGYRTLIVAPDGTASCAALDCPGPAGCASTAVG